MNKADLVVAIAKETGLTQAQAASAINVMLSKITDAIKKGEKVTLVGFGTFTVAQRKERKGRNPQTGAEITIPAKKVVKFSPGAKLRDAAASAKIKK
mgnify:CR=1 FL=1